MEIIAAPATRRTDCPETHVTHEPERRVDPMSRRGFLGSSFALAAIDWRAWLPSMVNTPPTHPDPRPGITAAHVLDPDQFKAKPRIAELYTIARAIPEVLDGIHCYCECHESMSHRSLLSCFESEQPAGCYTCGSEARLVHRLHGEGKILAEIRTACDRKFG
jgi:hypothetical protein